MEEVARQVLLIHKEFSTRSNRKTSRLRYTIAGKGLGWFTNELATRLPFPLQEAKPFSLSTNGDAADVPGRQTIEIEGGRIQNSNRQQLKTAFHEIASIHQGDFFITGNQNLVIDGITPDTAVRIKSIIRKYNLLPNDSGLRRNSSACTSLPFCPQALTDSERLLPKLVDELESQLKRTGAMGRRNFYTHDRVSQRMLQAVSGRTGFRRQRSGQVQYLDGRFQKRRQTRLRLSGICIRKRNRRRAPTSICTFCGRTQPRGRIRGLEHPLITSAIFIKA